MRVIPQRLLTTAFPALIVALTLATAAQAECPPLPEACERTAKKFEGVQGFGAKVWRAPLRMLDRADSSYAE